VVVLKGTGFARVTAPGTRAKAGQALLAGLFLVAWAYLLSFELTSAAINLSEPVKALVLTGVPFVLGRLIKRRHPGHAIATLFFIMAYATALAVIVEGVGRFSAANPTRFSPWVDTVTLTMGHFLWLPGVYVPLFIMPLYFPNGQLLSPRWRFLVWLLIFFQVWYAAAVTFRPWPWPAYGIPDTRAWNGIAGSEPFFEVMNAVLTVVNFPVVPLVILSIVLRYRRSTIVERQQIKWPLLAVGAVAIIMAIVASRPELGALDAQYGYLFTWSMAMLFPLSIGIAILRRDLWDIDVVINRALVYGGLTALIIGTYLLLVAGLGALFQSQVNTLAGLVATGVIAILFQPVRERLQGAVNRLLYGERDDPAAVLARIAQEMEVAAATSAILPNLVRTIARTLKIPYVAIWLPDVRGQMEPVAVSGNMTSHVQTLPLTYRQRSIGRLIVAPRQGHTDFDEDEAALLATIATLTAPTVHAVLLSDEVKRSRRRIVTAREDERRRLRRDLHDGLGPQLASQTLGLEAVSQLMRVDPDRAEALLDSLKVQAEEATLDVRRVVYNLRPPALDDLGLEGAIRQIAVRYETADLHFQFDLRAPHTKWPAALETALYRIAQEAMTNVVRHAGASLCSVGLSCAEGHVAIEVRDNGGGLPVDYSSGVGVQAMWERATELDGELLLAPLPDGGTLVRARFPLEVHRE
jgi:signal transduction histidine kinase